MRIRPVDGEEGRTHPRLVSGGRLPERGDTMSANSHPVAVTALFQAKAGKVDELRSLLKTLVAPTRLEAGCIRYDLHENPDATGSFIFLEAWRSEPDLERHLASVHVQAFRTKLPDLIAAPPVITLWRQIA